MIRNYNSPEGTLSLIDSTSVNSPKLIFTSTNTGATIAAGGTKQDNAITTMVLCNTGTPDPDDESVNSVTVNIYLVKGGKTYAPANLIVSNLIIPAGETVFFSDEKIILSGGVSPVGDPDELWIGTSAANLISVTVSALPV